MQLGNQELVLSTIVCRPVVLQSIIPRTVSLRFCAVRFFELSFLDPQIEKKEGTPKGPK